MNDICAGGDDSRLKHLETHILSAGQYYHVPRRSHFEIWKGSPPGGVSCTATTAATERIRHQITATYEIPVALCPHYTHTESPENDRSRSSRGCPARVVVHIFLRRVRARLAPIVVNSNLYTFRRKIIHSQSRIRETGGIIIIYN